MIGESSWSRFKKHPLGVVALILLILFFLVAVYAPLLASSKPLYVRFDGVSYFPLFRYLFYEGFYTKRIDLFFNLMIFTLPLFLLGFWRRSFFLFAFILQIVTFSLLLLYPLKNPAHKSSYQELNKAVHYRIIKDQEERIGSLLGENQDTLYRIERERRGGDHPLEKESKKIEFIVMPLLRSFHWEEDAGGSQATNQTVPWWESTRLNRRDFSSALLFGIRISLVVAFVSVALSLLIAIPFGAVAGYFGGKIDMALSRLLEVWESMPVFFILLLVVGILETRSLFVIMTVIGIFGWTGFCRFVRAEFLRQKNLPYVETLRASGYSSTYIMRVHILPNAIPPLLTLLPFAMMGAITSEAGLSFLGLGEEGIASWGVLMDEGRAAFPSESYLLWPPAILLTILLVAIALFGDAVRDTLDPKLHFSKE